ncbi:MAG TPA: DUF2461 domain-containing protein [Kofleriaceae bacterium]|nr:DUF2461 domain-containing protein [Kofleriaceae bacterium]
MPRSSSDRDAAARTKAPARTAAKAKAASAGRAAKPAKAATAKGAEANAAAFGGFEREAPRFFHELAAEMSREWFGAHKAEYEALWVRPMNALLAEVRARLAAAYKGLALAEPKVFRIHRDVRFSNDKTPYKTQCAGIVSIGGGATMETGAAVYLHLGLDEYAGAGFYGFTPDQLVRWRKAVAADRTGKQLAALLAQARDAGLALDAQEVLVRVPRGLDPEHPRAELLRHKGCVLGFPAIPRGLIHQPAFAGWLVEQATRAAPVVRWLEQHVA